MTTFSFLRITTVELFYHQNYPHLRHKKGENRVPKSLGYHIILPIVQTKRLYKMAKQKQNEMKEHILESLHSILMNRHFNKHLLLALKKRRQVQKQIVILQKPIQASMHAGSTRNQDLAAGTP
jgi:hypothetical protein